MKKVILIYPKMGASFVGRPPLSILSLAAYLEKMSVPVSVFDMNQVNDWRSVLLNEADEALFVGISAITGNQIKNGLEITRFIKINFRELPVVWGGVHPSLVPEQTLADKDINIVVRGEGEETLSDLAKAFRDGGNLDNIPGISFKKNGKIIHNPKRAFLEMEKLPNPAWHSVDINRYYFSNLSSKNVALQTSRGCPHSCQFCYNLKFNDRKWRAMSAERILQMIIPLKEEYNVDGVVFWDDNFFVDFSRVEDFCKMLIKNNVNIKWEADCRIDYLCRMDKEFLNLLKASGLSALFLGAESGSQKVLDNIKKGITLEQTIKSAEITAHFNFNVWYAFMIGFPDEDKNDILSTVRTINRVRKINPRANAAIKVFSPLPGTPLFEKAKQVGFCPPNNLAEWGNYMVDDVNTPWVNHKFFSYFSTCARFANEYNRFSGIFRNPITKFLARTLHFIEKFRWDYEFYFFPIELMIVKKIIRKLGYS